MIKLFKYLKPYIPSVIAAPLFMFLEVMMDTYLPKLMSDIVDVGVSNRDMDYVIKTGCLMVLMALIGAVGGVGCTVFSTHASMNFGRDVRSDLFKKVQNFSFANLDKFSSASLITRLTNDVTQVQQIVIMMLRMMVRSPLLFLGGIIMAYSLNKQLSVIFLVAIPLIIAFIVFIMKKGFPLFMIAQQKLDRLNLVMRENLAGVRVVKAFVREDQEQEKFDIANEDLKKTNVMAFRVVITLFPIAMTIMNLSVVTVLWLGGVHAGEGISAGNIMAYINYMTQILMSLMMLGMLVMGISRGKVSADRINEVLEAEIDIVNPKSTGNATSSASVEFRHVTFRYPESTGDPVLTNITFSAKSGESIGILGQTGAGKTSLVSLIPRLYDTESGSVLVNGLDVREYDLEELRKKIGFVLQQSILFTGTIKENIKWGNPGASDDKVVETAKTAQAHDFIIKQQNGYDTELGQAGVNLSGGQKQRVAIARALMKNPEILVFDDSTSAVDMATEAKLQKGLRKNNRDCIKFIIAQRISSVIDADKIIVLDAGVISAMGNHEQLMESSQIYRDIYYSQRKEEVLIHE